MSETESHKGTLVPITNLPEGSLEEQAREICLRLGLEMPDWLDNWLDTLDEGGYRKVHLYQGVFYEVRDTELDPNGFIEGAKNEDGSIDYAVTYYNGGAGFGEIMDAVIKKANTEAT